MPDRAALAPDVPVFRCPASIWDAGPQHTCKRFCWEWTNEAAAHLVIHREADGRFRCDLRNAPLRWRLPELLTARVAAGGAMLSTWTVNRLVIEKIRGEDLEYILSALALAVRTRG